MRTYELTFVADPRLSEDEVKSLTNDYRKMIEGSGARVVKEEQLGRRKLAYEIAKLTEGRYVLLHIVSEDGAITSLPEVEHRMRQNDKVLRFLTVRTDEDLRRAGLPLPTMEAAEEPAEAGASETPAGGEEAAAGKEG